MLLAWTYHSYYTISINPIYMDPEYNSSLIYWWGYLSSHCYCFNPWYTNLNTYFCELITVILKFISVNFLQRVPEGVQDVKVHSLMWRKTCYSHPLLRTRRVKAEYLQVKARQQNCQNFLWAQLLLNWYVSIYPSDLNCFLPCKGSKIVTFFLLILKWVNLTFFLECKNFTTVKNDRDIAIDE